MDLHTTAEIDLRCHRPFLTPPIPEIGCNLRILTGRNIRSDLLKRSEYEYSQERNLGISSRLFLLLFCFEGDFIR